MEIEIQPFDPVRHSGQRIAQLHLQLRQWQDQIGETQFGDINSSQQDLGDIPAAYLAAGGQFFVASDKQGEILGFVGLQKAEGELRVGILKRMSVMPQSQGQGIGSQLCQRIIGWAEAAGYQKIRLSTGNRERAMGIYWRQGFRVVGYDQARNDVRMELDFRRLAH